MKTTKEMIEVMQAFESGKPLEFRHRVNDVWVSNTTPQWDWSNCDYRIKPLAFPDLPEDEQFHNPDNLSPEQFGEGFRPITETERKQNDNGPARKEIEAWTDTNQWSRVCYVGDKLDITYRVPISTPFPEVKREVMVELQAADIQPGDVFKPIHWSGNRGLFITLASVRTMMVCFNCETMEHDCDQADGTACSWGHLKEHWLISRDNGQTWTRCEKPTQP